MIRAAIVAAAAFVPMLLEARRSRRNEAILRGRRRRTSRRRLRLDAIAYPGCFVAIVAEALLRQQPAGAGAVIGVVIFLVAKALKYSAIAALGERWTFRVLVLPGRELVTTGPYRWLRHPNYVGVAGELIGAALMAGSPSDRRYRFHRVRWDDAGAHPCRGPRAQYLWTLKTTRSPLLTKPRG